MPSTRTHFSFPAADTNALVTAGVKRLTPTVKAGFVAKPGHIGHQFNQDAEGNASRDGVYEAN